MEDVPFATFDKLSKKYVKVTILKTDLEKFPLSLLCMIVNSSGFNKKYDNKLDAYVIDISPSHLLEHIAYFYKTSRWKNPYLRENGIDNSDLTRIIDYLNLPDDYEEVEDPEEEYPEDDDLDYAELLSEESDEYDPSCRDDRFDDGCFFDDIDPNPYGHT